MLAFLEMAGLFSLGDRQRRIFWGLLNERLNVPSASIKKKVENKFKTLQNEEVDLNLFL